MRYIQLVLFTAIAVLGLATNTLAVPVISPLGNYNLLPNTPGQKIPLYVSGIAPHDAPSGERIEDCVEGMVLGVAIGDGGLPFGGTPGPVITSIDVDSGPTIWVAPNTPAGHNSPHEYYLGQLAAVDFLTVSGYVNVSGGLLATLVVDTTGFNSGTYPLTLSGGAVLEFLGSEYTSLIGLFPQPGDPTNPLTPYDGTPGQITIVPEPSSMVLAAIGLIGLAAWGWRRNRPAH